MLGTLSTEEKKHPPPDGSFPMEIISFLPFVIFIVSCILAKEIN